jgi:hypothetical protein
MTARLPAFSVLVLTTALLCALGPAPAARPAAAALKKGELPSTGWGALTGTVSYDGDPPIPKMIDFGGNKDAQNCHAGAAPQELVDQTWLVNEKNKGVPNAVIALRPPARYYFKIKPEDKRRPDVVTLRQPHCAFVPHVLVHFPAYYSPLHDDYVRTGQKLVVVNDAKFNHNTGYSGAGDKGNPILAPGNKLELNRFLPDPDLAFDMVGFKCDIHPWMHARALVFEHPYAAATDNDGKFEIKNVPTGAKLYVLGWHEGAGYFFGGKEGKEMTLKEGKNTLELKIKAR